MKTKGTIEEIMTRDVIWVDPKETLYEAFQLIRNFSIRHLPVVNAESKQIVGILSEGDIILHCHKNKNNLEIEKSVLVEDAMTKKVVYCYSSSNIFNVAATLITAKINSIPVLNEHNHELIGIVTTTDFLNQLCHSQEKAGKHVHPINHPQLQRSYNINSPQKSRTE